MPPRAAQYPEQQAHSRIPMSVPIGGSRRACGAGRASSRRAEQSSRHGQQAGGQASVPVGRGRAWPGFETTRQANDQQPSAGGVEAAAGPARQASVPVGGGRAWPGFETTRQANDQQPSAGGVEAAAGPAGPGRGAGGRRQGQGGLSDRTKHRRYGGRRGACRAWPGFETTRRAKLAARTASGRAGPAAAGNQAVPQTKPQTSGATSPARKSELLVVLRVLVGLTTVGATEGANRSHLFGRQREGEDVEVLALALRVTGLRQGQGAELVVPAQDEALR